MHRTQVKICGICRTQDAVLAARLGADAIGMILVPGAGRYVSIEEARDIAAAVPVGVTPVLLYVDAPVDAIRRDLNDLGRAAVVQLHGEEPTAAIQLLGDVPVYKAVRMDAHARDRLADLRAAKLANLVGVVLETPGQSGGSGVGNDWALVRSLLDEGAFEGLPLIAAGGLTPETVADVVHTIHPWAVDVSSGVEAVKRQKSEAKMAAFIAAVRGESDERQATSDE